MPAIEGSVGPNDSGNSRTLMRFSFRELGCGEGDGSIVAVFAFFGASIFATPRLLRMRFVTVPRVARREDRAHPIDVGWLHEMVVEPRALRSLAIVFLPPAGERDQQNVAVS